MASTRDLDYIIIGAGPAGLQMGYFLEQSQCHYLILEAASHPGSFFARYPRRRSLISFNKIASIYEDPEIVLRWDWNSLLTEKYEFLFKDYSQRLYPEASEMVRYLAAFSRHYALKIEYETRVVHVSRDEHGLFLLEDQNRNTYSCPRLIVATGFSQPYIPDIPGIELAECYSTVSMNPQDFLGQRVLIIGKGNSGFEIADNILSTAALIHIASPHPLQLAWNTKHPGHLRAEYTRILDTYQLKLLNSVLDCEIHAITQRDKKLAVSVTYSHADGEKEEMLYDRVISCTGSRFDETIFQETCRPALTLNDRFPQLTSEWESVNVPGLFFAGTLMQVRDFKKTSSAFVDGFRYNIRVLFRFLQARSTGGTLPSTTIEATADMLTEMMLGRISHTSALWTQFGYLCDLIVVDESQREATYYQELPVDYIHDSVFGQQLHYYTITYEWGGWQGDVFAIERHPNNYQADQSAFLHPIVRRFVGSRCLAEHHMLEDLFGMYCHHLTSDTAQSISQRTISQYHSEEHEQPLRQFFASQLGA